MGVPRMAYYHYQQANDMSYYTPHTQDMSSYVAVQGTPRKDNSFVFGLTPKEVRYLRSKFHSSRRPSDPCTTPPQQPSHGVCVQAKIFERSKNISNQTIIFAGQPNRRPQRPRLH